MIIINSCLLTHVNSCEELSLIINNRVRMVERNRTKINLKALKKIIHN